MSLGVQAFFLELRGEVLLLCRWLCLQIKGKYSSTQFEQIVQDVSFTAQTTVK